MSKKNNIQKEHTHRHTCIMENNNKKTEEMRNYYYTTY